MQSPVEEEKEIVNVLLGDALVLLSAIVLRIQFLSILITPKHTTSLTV